MKYLNFHWNILLSDCFNVDNFHEFSSEKKVIFEESVFISPRKTRRFPALVRGTCYWNTRLFHAIYYFLSKRLRSEGGLFCIFHYHQRQQLLASSETVPERKSEGSSSHLPAPFFSSYSSPKTGELLEEWFFFYIFFFLPTAMSSGGREIYFIFRQLLGSPAVVCT